MCLFFVLTVTMAQTACMEHGIIARPGDASVDGDAWMPDTGVPDADTNTLRFTDVICDPDVLNGQSVADNSPLECNFRVVGAAGRLTDLFCETPWGAPMDCHQDWPPRWLEPSAPVALPIDYGWFGMVIGGPPPLPTGLVWVADDGVQQARFELGWVIKVNHAPDIWLECGGSPSGSATVLAGELLQCVVHTTDPDPGDEVHWTVVLAQGRPPEVEPAPQWGQGPGATPWAWQTAAIEAGETLTYRFYAHDNTANAPHFNLVVSVQ